MNTISADKSIYEIGLRTARRFSGERLARPVLAPNRRNRTGWRPMRSAIVARRRPRGTDPCRSRKGILRRIPAAVARRRGWIPMPFFFVSPQPVPSARSHTRSRARSTTDLSPDDRLQNVYGRDRNNDV